MVAAPAQRLEDLLERDDLTIEALVELSEELLAAVAPEQTRYKVRERPDVRTIRYYVTQGLLPKPLGYEGGRARYGGGHLLRLLAIKRFQAEHQTLGQIAARLKALDDEALLALVLAPERRADTLALAPRMSRPPARGGPALVALHKIELESGGSVELPAKLLVNPAARRRLAAELRAAAAWLEGGADED